MNHRRGGTSRSTPESGHRHARLLATFEHRLGHALLGAADVAKIAVADAGSTAQMDIPLDAVEDGLAGHLTEPNALAALEADMARIVAAGVDTAGRAVVAPEQVDVVYLTGGSTGQLPLATRIAPPFTHARTVRGDRQASVAQGMGRDARWMLG